MSGSTGQRVQSPTAATGAVNTVVEVVGGVVVVGGAGDGATVGGTTTDGVTSVDGVTE
jgi:hypothetical protein